jgi:hypothetical protein
VTARIDAGGTGTLAYRRRANYATLSPNPPVKLRTSRQRGCPRRSFPNCRQEHQKARSEPIHDNTRTLVLSTGGEEESGITAATGGADDEAAAGGREASEPSAQWAVEPRHGRAPWQRGHRRCCCGLTRRFAVPEPGGIGKGWVRGVGRARARAEAAAGGRESRRATATVGVSASEEGRRVAPRPGPTRAAAPVSRRSAPPHTRRPPLARRARSCRFGHARDRVSRSVCWLPSSATHVNPARAACARVTKGKRPSSGCAQREERATHSGTGDTGPTLPGQFWRGVLIWFSQSSLLQQVNVVMLVFKHQLTLITSSNNC